MQEEWLRPLFFFVIPFESGGEPLSAAEFIGTAREWR
jgi:hypothetical protein